MDILNVHMIRNLRLLRRGIGSMDYIHTRFAKLSVRVIYAGEIRYYREYIYSAKSFRKAAYSRFILARHGHLVKGNGRVCPFCVVLRIRGQYPSLTGVYMGYREREYTVLVFHLTNTIL